MAISLKDSNFSYFRKFSKKKKKKDQRDANFNESRENYAKNSIFLDALCAASFLSTASLLAIRRSNLARSILRISDLSPVRIL